MSPLEARRRARHLGVLVCVPAVGLAVFMALSGLAASPGHNVALTLAVTPVPLDAADPSRMAVGPLRYMGGLWLRSDDPRFGGLSDLRVSGDGSRLWAVSDCGHGLTARLSYDSDGRLAGIGDARLVALTDASGGPLAHGEIDAESLVAAIPGELEVGFEGRARLQAYGPDFAGPARPLPAPESLEQCGRNGGLELMADLGAGRRLLACEARRGASTSVPAWLGAGGRWQQRDYPLTFDGGWAGEPFRPTGAARLPDGDLLIVERRFPPLSARLVRVARGTLDGTGGLESREVARLESPLTLDNIEGVEALRDARGRTLLYLLSDDNNCAKTGNSKRAGVQRTLLLLFVLAD